jgi:exosortase D (VPLPA-CTERM-specific)
MEKRLFTSDYDPVTLKSLLSVKNITLIIIALGTVLLLYWDVFSRLIEIWDTTEEYGHGFIIPVITLYFIWEKRALILSYPIKGSWLGLFFIIFALLGYFVGTVGDVGFLLRFSLIASLLGLSLAFLGLKITKIILIPILILIFSFPLPPVLQAGLTAKMQLISSELGVIFIRFCNIPVFLEGNMIDLGHYRLQVVEACSGLNYLFPLMSLSFIAAYLYQVTLWKRILLFLTSIPITILMNSFRIGVVGLLVEYFGNSMAEGFVHDFEGWVVFMGCLLVLVTEMWLLSWNERKVQDWSAIFGLPFYENPRYQKGYHFPLMPAIISVILLGSAIFLIKPLGSTEDIIPERQKFSAFPLVLDNLDGRRDFIDAKTSKFLGLDDYLLINFKNPEARYSNLYVAYYESQKDGHVPHSPKLCMPGGGWRIIDLKEINIDGTNLNRVLIKKEKDRQLVYYWYEQRGRSIANEYALKWYTFLGAFQHQRTDGALVRLTTVIGRDEAVDVADKRLQKLMGLAKTHLKGYLPD